MGHQILQQARRKNDEPGLALKSRTCHKKSKKSKKRKEVYSSSGVDDAKNEDMSVFLTSEDIQAHAITILLATQECPLVQNH
jgi:hypothetical protein